MYYHTAWNDFPVKLCHRFKRSSSQLQPSFTNKFLQHFLCTLSFFFCQVFNCILSDVSGWRQAIQVWSHVKVTIQQVRCRPKRRTIQQFRNRVNAFWAFSASFSKVAPGTMNLWECLKPLRCAWDIDLTAEPLPLKTSIRLCWKLPVTTLFCLFIFLFLLQHR